MNSAFRQACRRPSPCPATGPCCMGRGLASLACGHCHLCPAGEIAARRQRRRMKLAAAKQGLKLRASPCASECDTAMGSDLESLVSLSSPGSPQSSSPSIRVDFAELTRMLPRGQDSLSESEH